MSNTKHPTLTAVQITDSSGQVYTVHWSSSTNAVTLNTDPHNHAAWTGDHKLNTTRGRAASYKQRFNFDKK